MKKLIITILALLVLAGTLFAARPQMTAYPKVLMKTTDSITLTWQDYNGGTGVPGPPLGNPCQVKYGISPSNYTGQITASDITSTTFTPASVGMTGGVYYCRVSDNVTNLSSDEFKLFIESTDATSYVSPSNGAYLNDLTPTFSWDAVSGVPYYTCMLFDSEALIDLSAATITIQADAIWVATTDQTSISYPSPDPSGYFDKMTPPPLMQGLTYTWAIINNYSNSTAMISEAFAGTSSFYVNPASAVSAPTLISPDDVTITASTVTLSWNASAGANNYQVYIKKKEQITEGIDADFSVPVWDGFTTNTTIDVPANIGLNFSKYDWYVIAYDGTGKGAKSNENFFYYEDLTKTASIHVTEFDSAIGVTDVAFATVFMETLSGGTVNPYPYTTNSDGTFSYSFPYGDYKYTIKKEGFNTAEFYVTIGDTIIMDPEFRITRSAYSAVGSVEDDSLPSNTLSGAHITATLNGATVESDTLPDGSFILYLNTYGDWDLHVTKNGYRPTDTTVSVVDQLISNTYEHTIGAPIVLERNQNVLSGQVTNESAQGVFNALVKAYEPGNTANAYTDYTNSTGNYSIDLPDGTWQISVVKTGFVSPPESSVVFAADGPKTRNFTLQTAANIITGYITRDGAPFENVLVRAVPLAGSAIETYTNASGLFSISVGTGDFTIDALASGYTSDGQKNISFAVGGNTSSGNNFIMSENGSTVSGNITIDSGGTTPLQGAFVTNGIDTDYTDVNGDYTLSMLSGSYTIVATKAGYSSDGDEPVTVGPGDHLTGINFVLSPNAAVIMGDVKSNSGVAVSNATVYAVGPGVTQTVQSDVSGNYAFSVTAGEYSVSASKPGFVSSASTQIDLLPGQTSSGNTLIITKDIGYLSGIVADDSAAVVSGALVTVYNASGVTQTTNTLSDGSYLFGIKSGGYEVFASKSGYISSESRTGSVTPADTFTSPDMVEQLTLTANAKTISGFIDDGSNPVNGALVTVVAPGVTATAMTNGSGNYSIDVPGISDVVDVTISKAGYVTDNAQPGFGAAVTYTHNRMLTLNYGTLSLTIDTSPPAAVNAVVSANGNTIASTGTTLMSLLPGTYTVTITQSGYESVTRSAVVITGGVTTNIGLNTLNQIVAARTISGNVQDGAAANLQGATVEIRKQSDNSLVATALTDSSGNFSVSGLQALAYYVKVFKSGYDVPATQNADVTSGNVTGLAFTLNILSADVYVHLYDSSNSSDISGASVNLVGTGGNAGYSGSGMTDSSGGVTITAMNPGNYNLNALKSGYLPLNTTAFLIGSTTNNYNESMTPDPLTQGLIAGIVTNSSGAAMQNITVEIYNNASPESPYSTVVTDVDGYYGNTVPAGSYTMKPLAPGYSSSPPQDYATLSGLDYALIDFKLTAASGGGVVISGPIGKIFNSGIGGPYNFSASYRDGSGAIVPAAFSWGVVPSSAGSVSSSGVYTPQSDFIGEIEITASALGNTGRYPASVWQKLTPTAITVHDYEGFTLSMPAGSANISDTIKEVTLYKDTPSRARGSSRDYRVAGDIYKLTEGVNFLSDVTLSLPVSAGVDMDNATIGMWNENSISWSAIGGTKSGNTISVNTGHFSEYAVLVKMTALGLDNVTLLPNPFSPLHNGPIDISYSVNSLEGSSVETTIKIFNVDGQLVRNLFERQLRSTSTLNVDKWDGKDDSGRWAANGRYLVQIEVKDTSGKKQYIYMIALVK